jgi:type I restriction enzyme M protein
MSVAEDLWELDQGCIPKQIILDLSESLLAHYRDQPLIDAYAIFQHLMDYWAETMQDDCYLIAADGWKATPQPIFETVKSGKNKGRKKKKDGPAISSQPLYCGPVFYQKTGCH